MHVEDITKHYLLRFSHSVIAIKSQSLSFQIFFSLNVLFVFAYLSSLFIVWINESTMNWSWNTIISLKSWYKNYINCVQFKFLYATLFSFDCWLWNKCNLNNWLYKVIFSFGFQLNYFDASLHFFSYRYCCCLSYFCFLLLHK